MVTGSSTSRGGGVTNEEPSPSGSCSRTGVSASSTALEPKRVQALMLVLFSFASRLPVVALRPYGKTEVSQLLHFLRSATRGDFLIRLSIGGTLQVARAVS